MERQALELRDIARMLSRHKLLVVFLLAACLAGSILYTSVAPRQFSASSRLLLLPVAPGSSLRPSGGTNTAGPLGLDMDPSTQAQVVDSPLVAARVAKSQRLRVPPSALAGMVAVQAGETQVLQINATAGSPKLAAILANGFAEQYIAYRRALTSSTVDALARETEARMAQLERQLDETEDAINALQSSEQVPGEGFTGGSQTPGERRLDGLTAQREDLADQLTALRQRASDLNSSRRSVQGGAGQIIERAVPSTTPVRPKAARDVPLGLLIGLLTSVVSVFALEYFDDKIRSRTDVESRTGVQVLALVPRLGLLRRWRLRSGGAALWRREPRSSAYAYRRLRARLLAYGVASRRAAIIVASLDDGGDAAMVVTRLAAALGRADFRTLIVSMDVRRHRVESLLEVQGETGLTDVLMDHRPLSAVAAATNQANLWVVPAGSGGTDDTDLFASNRLRDVLDEARQFADVVLVEAPAGSTSGDLAILASQADGSVVVAKAGATRYRVLRAALRELGAVDSPLLGVVLADRLGREGPGEHARRGAIRPTSSDSPREASADGASPGRRDASTGARQ